MFAVTPRGRRTRATPPDKDRTRVPRRSPAETPSARHRVRDVRREVWETPLWRRP
ncbi:hypothetical protein SSCG_02101 [Streptomyces clavuligerus]|nr:hypothetical protein SSCG_02101 [Streptomyces clavuligerus]